MAAKTETIKTPVATMPHLESLNKLKKIPLLETAWNQTTKFYGKVKNSNRIFGWALLAAGTTVHKAMEQAVPIAAPIANKLDTPIRAVDQLVCKGITMIENKIPIVKEQPEQIFQTAKSYILAPYGMLSTVKDLGSKVQSLKEFSWNKGNEILATRYGSMAYNGINTAAKWTEQYIDQYLPTTKEQVASDKETPETEDKVLGAVATFARLSSKIYNGLYTVLTGRVQKVENQNVEHLASTSAASKSPAKDKPPTEAEEIKAYEQNA